MKNKFNFWHNSSNLLWRYITNNISMYMHEVIYCYTFCHNKVLETTLKVICKRVVEQPLAQLPVLQWFQGYIAE